MGILVDSVTRVIVQGITGTQGSLHTLLMLEYGTKVVAGTSPGKGGENVYGIPVYDTVEEAQERHLANSSIIFAPAQFAAEAAIESLEQGIKTIIVITEHIPLRDTIELISYAKQVGANIVGPNTPGVITPGRCKLGILPSNEFAAGNVGIISRSGTLMYEIASTLTKAGIGQSTCLGLGGDQVTGLNFIDALEMFKDDPETKAVVLIGEIGGNIEELAAQHIMKEGYPKPVVAYVAGRSAPAGRRMGHAGAIVMGKSGTAKTKIAAFETAGAQVALRPRDVARLLIPLLNKEKF